MNKIIIKIETQTIFFQAKCKEKPAYLYLIYDREITVEDLL